MSAPPASTPAAGRLAAGTGLGPADRAVAFYQEAIGLRLHRRAGEVAAMGAGADDVLVLHERPDARPAGRHAGLYHVALLFPSRAELARAGVRLATRRVPVQGASDHGTHEAIYLADPDGNGLELAADRPRSAWPSFDVAYAGGPQPLDVRGLLGAVAGEELRERAEPGLGVGHVHLHVADLDAATRFYRDGLGFDVVAHLPSAVFVSAGGYHHHVGFNTWRGEGVPPAPADAVGLRRWTLAVDGADELAAVRARLEALGAPVEDGGDALLARDPSGIAVLVRPR